MKKSLVVSLCLSLSTDGRLSVLSIPTIDGAFCVIPLCAFICPCHRRPLFTLVLPNAFRLTLKETCGHSRDIILVRLAVAVHHQHARHRRRL